MKPTQTIFLLVVLLLGVHVSAQTGTDVVAQIGVQKLTVKDLGASAQAAVEQLQFDLLEARRRILDEMIDEALFEAEAAARRTTPETLFDTEIKRRVAEPAAAQIQTLYEANRARLGDATMQEARPQLVAYLKRESEGKIAADVLAALRQKHKITPGIDAADIKTAKPTDVLARVGTQTVTVDDYNERLKPVEYELRFAAYQTLKNAAESNLYSTLILSEAKRQNVQPEEIVRREITERLQMPSDADARKFYAANKDNINAGFDAARASILTHLENQERARLETALRTRLYAAHNAKISLIAPPQSKQKISVDDDPVIGSVNAPVTIVMFTDFQCPACAAVHPFVKKALADYGDKVRLVVRDFPLIELHPDAQKAAEAANAANAQGKYLDYIETLYANQRALDTPALKRYAVELKLDSVRFDADLDGGKFADEVRKDRRAAQKYGARGTPTIFVNGFLLNEVFTAEALNRLIDAQLQNPR